MIAVGIDVSKSKSTVAILSSDGEILAKPFSIRHVESDIDNLITYLRSLQDDVKVVMESTYVSSLLFPSDSHPYSHSP